MAINFNKNTCDTCGKKKPSRVVGMMRDENGQYPNSFYLGQNGEVWCSECYKEKKLKELFDLMDARDRQREMKNTPPWGIQ